LLVDEAPLEAYSEEDEKARYEALLWRRDLRKRRKYRSGSLKEFREKQKRHHPRARLRQGAEAARGGRSQVPQVREREGPVFPDGGAICNNCGKMFQV